MTNSLLAEIEAYYDAVPRRAARAEDLPPFTVFVNERGGWPYYARPRLGSTAFTAEDVARVRARQRALGVPEAFEWVAEVTPHLREAAEAGGLAVSAHPLMMLEEDDSGAGKSPNGVEVRLVTPEDDIALFGAVAAVGFSAPGTATGPEGAEQLMEAAAARPAEMVSFERERLRVGWTASAVALVDGMPVGIGSHQPVGAVSEVAGVATLPAFRRRGIGEAVTRLLVADARRRGVGTVFLSAAGDTVARIYERIGFRHIATACIAEPSAAEAHG